MSSAEDMTRARRGDLLSTPRARCFETSPSWPAHPAAFAPVGRHLIDAGRSYAYVKPPGRFVCIPHTVGHSTHSRRLFEVVLGLMDYVCGCGLQTTPPVVFGLVNGRTTRSSSRFQKRAVYGVFGGRELLLDVLASKAGTSRS